MATTVPQLPGALNFSIYIGATFQLTLTWTDGDDVPVDLTGYTAACTIRADQDTILSLTTTNGRIVLGGTAGTIVMTVDADDTAALTAVNAAYDLMLTSGDDPAIVTPLVAGLCTVRRGQTV
jgi:hypothetical protein